MLDTEREIAVEKGAKFKNSNYNNGYRDNNSYLGKSKACYCYCKRGKKRDRFLDF